MMDLLISLMTTSILAGGVLAMAALGGVLIERVGVLNLGAEGVMAMGAMVAIATVDRWPSPWIGLIAAMAVGLAMGAIYATATVIVRADQIVAGLALTMLGSGVASAWGRPFAGMPAKAVFADLPLPWLNEIPLVGTALFSQNVLVYFVYLLLPVTIHLWMFQTRPGLRMRAVGEDPAAADAAGLSVMGMRFTYVCLGCGLSAAAGAYLTLAFVHSWTDGLVAGRGWIAIALVIFARHRPLRAAAGALFFGAVTSIGFLGQARNWPVIPALLSSLPYLATLAVVLRPWISRQHAAAGPAALGQPYFRDLR